MANWVSAGREAYFTMISKVFSIPSREAYDWSRLFWIRKGTTIFTLEGSRKKLESKMAWNRLVKVDNFSNE